MKKLTPFLLTLFITTFYSNSHCQTAPCGFDETMGYELNETPDFQFLRKQAEKKMEDMMNNNIQAIMNSVVYTVPVVFHIIHRGEPIGSGSNISDAQTLQALADLNSDFRDYPILGNDVEIEFCLAQRDPQGNSQYNTSGDNITGIRRVDGTGTENYENIGMTRFYDGNEVAVKALSNWPNTDYLNIWIVHEIAGDVIGFATFPETDDSKDGVVLEAIATGTPDYSKILTHEVGHFLDIYHTFEGSSSYNLCPPNDDCQQDGDKICDTRPHPYMNNPGNWFPCTESSYESCDPTGSYYYNVIENHMNYTDNDCRDEFTPGQVMHMRCALMTLRPNLLNSLGCLPACPGVTVDFTPDNIIIEEQGQITFTNNSLNAISYVWEVEDETFEVVDLVHVFNERGIYNICLTASDSECSNRKCMEIKVIGSEPCYGGTTPCDLLLNGDFSKTNFLIEEGLYFSMSAADLDGICDWSPKMNTPDFAYMNEVWSSRLNSQKHLMGEIQLDFPFEGLVTESSLYFEAGKNYILEFDYLYAAVNPTVWDLSIGIGLAPDGKDYYNYAIDELLFEFKDGFAYQHPDPRFFWENFTASDFLHASLELSFEEDTEGHLFFNNEGLGINNDVLWLYLKDIKITCLESCIPLPEISFDQECPNTFVATNDGDGDLYQWEFLCDGFIASGPSVTRDFPAGTECIVCLTVGCDLENTATICDTITIPADIPEECMNGCIDKLITANTCEQSDGQVNEYITNFTITVPEGSGPCGEMTLQSNSTTVGVDLTSYMEAPSDTEGHIDVHIGMIITTPPGLDITSNTVAAGLTLCDPDGNIICYDLTVEGEECEVCLGSLSIDMACEDNNPVDGVYTYIGSIALDNLPGNSLSEYSLCTGAYSEIGFIPSISGSGTSIQLNAELTTINSSVDSAPILLCLEEEIQGEICINITINILAPCPPTPTDCVEEWLEKTVHDSCEIVDGQIKYDFDMTSQSLSSYSLQLCHDNIMWASIEGGGSAVVDKDSSGINGNNISFNIDIFMPCDFDPDMTYDLRIILCDEKGDFVCLLFPLKFKECSLDCGDGKKRNNGQEFSIIDDVEIYPNPAMDYVNIFVPPHTNKDIYSYNADIYDPMGKLYTSMPLVSGNNKINLYEIKNSGLFFVKISNHFNPSEMSIEKLFIENR